MFRFVTLAHLAGLLALATASALPPRLDGKIVGGEDANIQDFPYQLSLQTYGHHSCGASIIDKRWAVTAAHCTEGSTAASLSVVAGISNLNDDGQRIQVKTIHQHPAFTTQNLESDISVLELAAEMNFDGSAQPVALAADGSEPADGTDVVCTGWGTLFEGGNISEQLQKVTIQIVDRKRCQEQYGSGKISENMICAGVAEGGKDACQVDSGGPLVANGKLVGVVSWGKGCGRPEYSGVYAHVGALRSYIKEKSGI